MWELGINSFLIKESDFFVPLSFQFTTEPLTLSVLAICGILVTMKPINGLTLHRVHCTASERIIRKLSLGFNTLPETYIFSSPEARYHISLILIYFQSTLCRVMQEGGGGGGGNRGFTIPYFLYHVLSAPVLLWHSASRLSPFMVLLPSSG